MSRPAVMVSIAEIVQSHQLALRIVVSVAALAALYHVLDAQSVLALLPSADIRGLECPKP